MILEPSRLLVRRFPGESGTSEERFALVTAVTAGFDVMVDS